MEIFIQAIFSVITQETVFRKLRGLFCSLEVKAQLYMFLSLRNPDVHPQNE